jgi:multidrug efflux pump subunit AcrA (membrane-fusion protein)
MNIFINKKLFFLLCLIVLSSCKEQPKSSQSKIISITKDQTRTTLFYTGTIRPLKTIVVPSPADGVIIDMPHQYGEQIKKDELLFVMSSTKFLTDYKTALMQYIKTKSDLNNSSSQLTEAKFLHKNQLISNDEFKMKQSNFYTAQLAYLQAKDVLLNLLHQLNIKNIDLNKLTITDIDKVMQALRLPTHSENLPILSPAMGVILSADKNEGENKKTATGDVVKQGDVLAVIGNMSGLKVRIKVNEINVNQLRAGQKVKVTGIAFSDHVLNGRIEQIDRQGDPSTNGLPTFLVEVVVPKLLLEELEYIHVGMSAKVEINIEETPQITIPLSAISEQNGASYVKIFDKQTGKTKDVRVKPGKTTIDKVASLSGLKEGECIVVPS